MLHTFRKCQSPVRAGKRAFKKIVDVKEKEINTINRELKHMINRNARFIRSQDGIKKQLKEMLSSKAE